MIELIEIEPSDLYSYVEAAYKDDELLLTKYHVDEYDLDGATTETVRMIEETAGEVEMKYYGVIMGEEKIGYLCIFKNNLYSFGVNIEKRNKEVLSEYWDKIIEVLGKNFICMLYENNTRAIIWLQRRGMIIVDDVRPDCVTLLNHETIKN